MLNPTPSSNTSIRELEKIAEIFGYKPQQVWGVEGNNLIIIGMNAERSDSINLKHARTFLSKKEEWIESERRELREKIEKLPSYLHIESFSRIHFFKKYDVLSLLSTKEEGE